MARLCMNSKKGIRPCRWNRFREVLISPHLWCASTMTSFLIDENMNQKAVRTVPTQDKGFDVLFPDQGGYTGASDKAVRDIATRDHRVLVSVERDFGQFGLKPEDMPDGAIWIRPTGRISQPNVGVLFEGL